MSKKNRFRLVAVAISVLVSLFLLEVALRLSRGGLLRFESFTAEPVRGPGFIGYHETFGWNSSPGRHGLDPVYGIEPSGLRSHGPLARDPPGPPILLVGDSFTFGDEVNDSDTWAARLQEQVNRRVLNAGVPAYGIDQAVLRAESLLDLYRPGVVILSFISDDISRTEYAFYRFGWGWKPYFEIVDGALHLRNTPVPRTTPPRPLAALRYALGYSYLADAVFRRTSERWWRNFPSVRPVHNDGERVSIELVVRLKDRVHERGGRFFVVAFATNGGLGGNRRLASGVKGLRERGIDVLDLSPEVLEVDSNTWPDLFMRDGHYSPAMNRRVAARIAAHLH